MTFHVNGVVEGVFREEQGRLLAVLAARLGDLDLAEEVAQEAVEAALTQWPVDGVPEAPLAWLLTTARRRAVDRIRRERAQAQRLAVCAAEVDRTGPAPRTAVVSLEDQDRCRWDTDKIDEGSVLVTQALSAPPTGPYTVQAAISALHDQAPDVASTDCPQAVALYDVLLRLTSSPAVVLNRAVAVARRDGSAAGLRLVDEIAAAPELRGYPWLPAARADLLARAGPSNDAIRAYRTAGTGEQRA